MDPKWFGDSYDIVKRSLLRWLSECGTWAVHPMFRNSVCQAFAEEFSSFLKVPLVTTSPVPKKQSERESYFECAIAWCSTDHLFLDPDTGLSLPGSAATQKHLKAEELAKIVNGRRGKFALVYDQSFSRGGKKEDRIKQKLPRLEKRGVYSLVYSSHANFILASSDETALSKAETVLREASRLPSKRFITYRDM